MVKRSLKKILKNLLQNTITHDTDIANLKKKTSFTIRTSSGKGTIAANSTGWISHGTAPTGAICPVGWYIAGWGTGVDVYAFSSTSLALKNMASESKTITTTIYWLCTT